MTGVNVKAQVEAFEEAFRKWAAKMERLTLQKKLHSDWIPQMNVEKGESYFFNVRTGESSEEHPNMRQVRTTERKQRQAGEEQITERLKRLKDYEDLLRSGEENHRSTPDPCTLAVCHVATHPSVSEDAMC